jgi:hypothetical protein
MSDLELKFIANRLARIVTAGETAAALRELRVFDALQNQANANQASEMRWDHEAHCATSRPTVGIWEQGQSGTFTRRADMFEEWYLWANVGRIPIKRAKRRVVLIGESVARGYLFDPQYTPAKALASILASHVGSSEFEVVDLARTDMGLDQLNMVARSAVVLEPDAVVIFAGNNWWGAGLLTGGVGKLAAASRERGVAGLKHAVEIKHRGSVIEAVRGICEFYLMKGIRLVWVMPEFNLGDWRDPETNAPLLPGRGNREWLEQWSRARKAMAARHFDAASRCAARMIELDEGTSVTGFYIQAACREAEGDLERARSHFESARDATMWSPFAKTPRPFAITHQTLREEAQKAGFDLVDLPALFWAHAGPLPNRRFFVDYCHLSAEGIQISMAATASCLVQRFFGESVSWKTLAKQSATPDRDTEAQAMFLAAIHNAHWRQRAEVVLYFCRRSLELSRDVARAMECLMEIQNRKAPVLMCKAAETVAELPFPLIRQYFLRWNYRVLDRVLLAAFADTLTEAGIDAKRQLEAFRIHERSAARFKVDLLDGFYTSSAEQDLEQPPGLEFQLANIRSDYYKAHSPESNFPFVGESGICLLALITFRLQPHAAWNECVSLNLNGHRVAGVPASSEWRTWKIVLPGEAVRTGINELTICWPHLAEDVDGEKPLEAIADDLLADIVPELYPVFGEIHSLTLSRTEASEIPAVRTSTV